MVLILLLAYRYELLEDTAQAIELYSQANSLAPTDPAILSKLANIYDAAGDKSQAFQCYYDVRFSSFSLFFWRNTHQNILKIDEGKNWI